MRRLFFLFLSAALALSLAACGGDPDPPGGSASQPDTSQAETQAPVTTPFTLGIYPEFSIHPALAANRANLTLAPLLYEGLFQLDETFQPVPVLCQSYTASEDKLVWTFTLHGGITFSDGTPLTGQAVAGALNLARSEQGRYAQRLSGVADITGEESTVTITLSAPNGALPALLDIPIALGEGDRPPGTGPYVLSGQEEELSLTARAGWWQKDKKSLPLQTIPLHAVHKSDELTYAFDTGSVSLVDVDLMATNAMGYGGNYQTWDYTTTDLVYLAFNTQSGPCRSAAVRQALADAIDRESIVQTSYASHGVPTALPIHPDSPLYDQAAAAALDYRPEGLAGRLEELKLAGRTLKLVVNSENDAKLSAAKRIAYQLESVGLTIQLEQLAFEDYAAALAQGRFDLYLGETVLTADFDAAALLSSAGGLNYGGWRDEDTDALIYAMKAAGGDARAQAAAGLCARLTEQVPIAPILFKNGSALTQWGRLSNLSPVRGNVFYGLADWAVE